MAYDAGTGAGLQTQDPTLPTQVAPGALLPVTPTLQDAQPASATPFVPTPNPAAIGQNPYKPLQLPPQGTPPGAILAGNMPQQEDPRQLGAVTHGGAAGYLGNQLLRGFIQGRAAGQMQQAAQFTKQQSGLQSLYDNSAQDYYRLAQSGADPNSPEMQDAHQRVQASWDGLMGFYGQHVPQPKGAAAKLPFPQRMMNAMHSQDPNEILPTIYEGMQRSGPPVFHQAQQYATPQYQQQVATQQGTQQTVGQAQNVGSQAMLTNAQGQLQGAQGAVAQQALQNRWQQMRSLNATGQLPPELNQQFENLDQMFNPARQLTGAGELKLYRVPNSSGGFDYQYVNPFKAPQGSSAVPPLAQMKGLTHYGQLPDGTWLKYQADMDGQMIPGTLAPASTAGMNPGYNNSGGHEQVDPASGRTYWVYNNSSRRPNVSKGVGAPLPVPSGGGASGYPMMGPNNGFVTTQDSPPTAEQFRQPTPAKAAATVTSAQTAHAQRQAQSQSAPTPTSAPTSAPGTSTPTSSAPASTPAAAAGAAAPVSPSPAPGGPQQGRQVRTPLFGPNDAAHYAQLASEGLLTNLTAIPQVGRGQVMQYMADHNMAFTAPLTAQEKLADDAVQDNIIPIVSMLEPLLEPLKNETGAWGKLKQNASSAVYQHGISPGPIEEEITQLAALSQVAAASQWTKIGRSRYVYNVIQQHLPDPTKDSPGLMYQKLTTIGDAILNQQNAERKRRNLPPAKDLQGLSEPIPAFGGGGGGGTQSQPQQPQQPQGGQVSPQEQQIINQLLHTHGTVPQQHP